MLEEPGVAFQNAAAERRAPRLMDLWEDAVPWGQMALTALKVCARLSVLPGFWAWGWVGRRALGPARPRIPFRCKTFGPP
jgi:hypothetical protein